jgi:hypothetical protein
MRESPAKTNIKKTTTPLSPQPKPKPNPKFNQRYEVLTCFLGKGDKETFAYGMLAMREPFYAVPTAPRPLGTTGEREEPGGEGG